MPRRRTGTVIAHGSHFDVRITLNDGTRSKRACLPDTFSEEQARAEAARLSALAAATSARRLPEGASQGGEAVRAWASRWFDDRERRGLDVRPDRLRWAKWIDAARVRGRCAFGDLPIASVTTSDAEDLVSYLDAKVLDGKTTGKSARNAWGLVRKALDDAAHGKRRDLRALPENPARNVRPPERSTRPAHTCLWPDELEAALRVEGWDVRQQVALALACYLGLRASELEALRWGDVDTERGRVVVHRGRRTRGAASGTTKAGRSRIVPIEPHLRPMLEVLRRGRDDADHVVVVPGLSHAPRWLRALLRAAGVTRAALFERTDTSVPIRLHDCRASYCTWRFVRGDSVSEVRDDAGHEHVTTTEIYLREARAIRGMREPFGPLPASFLRSLQSSSHGEGCEVAGEGEAVSWSGRWDLNPRQRAPKARALPDCATPRSGADASTGGGFSG